MEAVLLATSLLLVVTMLTSLWIATLRARPAAERLPAETADDTV
jgi:hypothetical protein